MLYAGKRAWITALSAAAALGLAGCAAGKHTHTAHRPPLSAALDSIPASDVVPVPRQDNVVIRGQDFGGRQLPTSDSRQVPSYPRQGISAFRGQSGTSPRPSSTGSNYAGGAAPVYSGPPSYNSSYSQPPASGGPLFRAPGNGSVESGEPQPLPGDAGQPIEDLNIRPDLDQALEQEPTDPYLPITGIVNEAQTGRLMLGIGVNSDAGVVGNIVVDEQNFDWRRVPHSWHEVVNGTAFRGAGQRFRIEAVPGTQVSRYTFSFQEPYLADTSVSLGLSAFYYNRQFTDWSEQRGGGRVALGYQFPDTDLSITTAIRYENVDIFNPRVPTPPELTRALGNNDLVGFRTALVHDTRDSPFLATQGHYIDVGFEEVTGTFTYPRVEAEWRQYFLIRERADGSGRHTLSFRSRVGITGDNTPIYDNFFAGGYSTLRGFAFRGASPRNMGVTVGGQFLTIGTVEYMLPITADDMLRAVAFVDFGTVEESVKIDRKDFRVAPGLGLRITVPAMGPAPIALDFAFPIEDEAGDQHKTFSFFIGFGR